MRHRAVWDLPPDHAECVTTAHAGPQRGSSRFGRSASTCPGRPIGAASPSRCARPPAVAEPGEIRVWQACSLDTSLDTDAQSELAHAAGHGRSESPRRAPRIAERLCKAKNRRWRGRGHDAGGGTRTPDTRIMIPDDFGLTIGDSRPVGHAVGHNRSSGRTPFRVSAASSGGAEPRSLVADEGAKLYPSFGHLLGFVS